MIQGSRRTFMGLMAAAASGLACPRQGRSASRISVRIAVAGINFVPYLPIALAKHTGAFEKFGLDVELISLSGGAPVATALIGGSVDVASGYYEHTIQFAARGKAVRCFVIATQLPGLALFVAPQSNGRINSIKDLAGKRVGVSAPGSATDFLLKYVLHRNGVDPASVSVLGLGEPASTVAAVEQGRVQAALNGEPAITVLQSRFPNLKILVDTRTAAGTATLFGSRYPAACLYAMSDWLDKNHEAALRLCLGMISTLRWIHAHKPEEIVARMPKEIVGADPQLYLAVVRHMMEIFSPDGLLDPKTTVNPYDVLKLSIPGLASARIDIARTFTNEFAEEANKQLGAA